MQNNNGTCGTGDSDGCAARRRVCLRRVHGDHFHFRLLRYMFAVILVDLCAAFHLRLHGVFRDHGYRSR